LWRERPQLDARIAAWSWSIVDEDLGGDLTWYSGFLQKDMTEKRSTCVIQLFNHQTHHRGQVHAMLTAAGARPDDTELQVMPAEDPECRCLLLRVGCAARVFLTGWKRRV